MGPCKHVQDALFEVPLVAMGSSRTPANQLNFKNGCIPKDIWCNPGLFGDEKLMWGETSSCENDLGCIA